MHFLRQIYGVLTDRRNLVLVTFLFVSLAITWATIDQIELNYRLEQSARTLEQEIGLLEVKKATQDLQNDFYQTDYYLDLSARDRLGRVEPGEQVLILPSAEHAQRQAEVQAFVSKPESLPATPEVKLSPLEQWVHFFSGRQFSES